MADASVIWAAEPTVSNAMRAAYAMILDRPVLLWTFVVCGLVPDFILILNRLAPPPPLTFLYSIPMVPVLVRSMLPKLFSITAIEFALIGTGSLAILFLTVEAVHQVVEFRAGLVFMRGVRRLPFLLFTNWIAVFIVVAPMVCVAVFPVMFMTFVMRALSVFSPRPLIVLIFLLYLVAFLLTWPKLALAGFRTLLDDDGPIMALRWSWDNTDQLFGLILRLIVLEFALEFIFVALGFGISYSNFGTGHLADKESTFRFLLHLVTGATGAYARHFFEVALCWVYLERRAGRI